MERNPWASRHSADSVGASARRILATGSSGTILACHSRATYLLSAADELLWLAPDDVPMHRRGVRVAGPLPRTAAGCTYRVAQHSLLVGSAAVIDVGHASTWEPERRTWPPRVLEIPPLRPTGGTSELLDGLPPPRGLGVLLPELACYAHGRALPSRARPRTPVLAHASPHVHGIARACRERDGSALLGHAVGLVGLGEGLTPSGDDFVGGVLFGVAMLRDAGVRLPGCSPRALAAFLESAQQRTNRISFALLGDHAAGHGCEPAHRLALALLEPGSASATWSAASDLVRIGHSTGWDVLTGVWTACSLIPRNESPIRRPAGPSIAFAATP